MPPADDFSDSDDVDDHADDMHGFEDDAHVDGMDANEDEDDFDDDEDDASVRGDDAAAAFDDDVDESEDDDSDRTTSPPPPPVVPETPGVVEVKQEHVIPDYPENTGVVHDAPAVVAAEQEAEPPEFLELVHEADEPPFNDEAQATLETQMDNRYGPRTSGQTSGPEKNDHTPATHRIQAVMVTSTLPLTGHLSPQARCP
jgi:hypothetical protein